MKIDNNGRTGTPHSANAPPPFPEPTRSITLIGMPGSGKSVVGKIIASRLAWSFLDTDRLIEQRFGMPLQAVIDRLGEPSFRKLEEETLLGLKAGERTVISTGGSVVYSTPGMQYLASQSTIIFLDASLDAIARRIRSQAPRGIVGLHEGGLEELFKERRPLYLRHADIVLHLDTESAEQTAAAVLRNLSEPFGRE